MIRAAVALTLFAAPASAQITNDPFPPLPAAEGAIVVSAQEFPSLPDLDGAPARLMLLVDEPGSGRMFVNDQWGLLYGVRYNGVVARNLDARDPRWHLSVKAPAQLVPITEVGMQSFAFHPHFAVPGTGGYDPS